MFKQLKVKNIEEEREGAGFLANWVNHLFTQPTSLYVSLGTKTAHYGLGTYKICCEKQRRQPLSFPN